VSGIVIKLRENRKLAGRREIFVKIATHNSKAPTVSLTGVKVSSNPTKITEGKKSMQDYKVSSYLIFISQTDNKPSSSMISTSETSGITTTGTVGTSARVRVRLNLSESSRASSSVIVTLKHCL
jgi:hypothetical protein